MVPQIGDKIICIKTDVNNIITKNQTYYIVKEYIETLYIDTIKNPKTYELWVIKNDFNKYFIIDKKYRRKLKLNKINNGATNK